MSARPLTVELDPSVFDWQPPCVVCGKSIESWDDAIAIGVARYEDDEPEALKLYHRDPCGETIDQQANAEAP